MAILGTPMTHLSLALRLGLSGGARLHLLPQCNRLTAYCSYCSYHSDCAGYRTQVRNTYVKRTVMDVRRYDHIDTVKL